MDTVVVRAGLKYGLIGSVICFIITATSVVHLSPAALGLFGPLVFFTLLVLFVYYLLIYAFAGRFAASQTGRASDGALAALITGILTNIFACIAVMGQSLLAPDTITHVGPSIVVTPGNVFATAARVLLNALSTFAVLAACAGLGALGGCAGRKAYRKAQRAAMRGQGVAAHAAGSR